ncbi:MAG: 4-hydroxythreonine-4-phosphate dehydrogenase PdxA [Alphaproteobacteria bacterium GM7ARS4]|nr:4-hydroxythreonine-4-phosphate dehydrogenase PdxA [Alphaproteobacteria bacterium GM7ARS4]
MPPIAVTMGEPSGIAPQLSVVAWHQLSRAYHRRETSQDVPSFFVIGDVACLERAVRMRFSHPDAVPIQPISHPREAHAVFPERLPVIPLPLQEEVRWGVPCLSHQEQVLSSIDTACRFVQQGHASAIVTNPIHKASLYAAGCSFPGHTEMMARYGGGTPVMMLCDIEASWRVALITGHCPFADVIAQLSPQRIMSKTAIVHDALIRDFAIARPRLALAALNPHAGESGRMGTEEQTILQPAIDMLRQRSIHVEGPVPADTLFLSHTHTPYDAIICLYHDQGLIPFKLLCFERGVNVTLGIPFIRTSPAHGVAFDIVDSGTARVESIIAALSLAWGLAQRRMAETA